MANRRSTRSKGKKLSEQDDDATSPVMDAESNPSLDAGPTTNPRPKPRPKPAKKPIAPSVLDAALDAVDDPDTQHQPPKRGRSMSDTDMIQPEPPAKKSKTSNTTSPKKLGGSEKSRFKGLPPRSPLPIRTNRVVNPGAPDMKRNKRTTAEVTVASQQKITLQNKLKEMERDKIRLLAQMEAVEEEEQRNEERKRIKNIADLAESHVGSETEAQNGMGVITRDNDIVEMADGDGFEEVDEADNQSELGGSDVVKKVSGLIHDDDFF
jgi:hypothetical protein